MRKIKLFLLALFFVSAFSLYALGLNYTYPLYPYSKDLSQTLTFKLMLRCALEKDYHNLDLGIVAGYLRQIDCITRGLPKVVILGGFQQGGHDHTYPWWTPIDSTLFAPGGLKGKEALQWLMKEAKKYNTNCTFHVNPFDAYDDSPMWNFYLENDLLCKNADGSLAKGDIWWERQSYFVNMVNEWNRGVTRRRIDELIEQMPLIKETGVLYFDNLTQYPPSLFHYITREDQISAIKKAAEYLKKQYNIQLIGEYADPNLYGINCLGITWDWWASLNINQMEVAPYIVCGGRDGTHDDLYGGEIDLTKRRFQVFGASMQLEDTQFQRQPFKVAREFSHHTLVCFYLNRLLRIKYETFDTLGIKLTLSDQVESRWDTDNIHRLYRDGKLMKEGHDVFIPVFWVNHPEIMAYSVKGRNGYWDLPREWADVESVDIYTFTSAFDGLCKTLSGIATENGRLKLALPPDEARIIVPTGTDMDKTTTIYSNPPTGQARFVGKDTVTQGNWKGKYGKQGYEIFGTKYENKSGVQIKYIGDTLQILNTDSNNPAALCVPESKSRIEAVRTSVLHQLAEISVPDGQEVKISLYVADYKKKNCQQVIDLIDVSTKQILASELINRFDKGCYLSFYVSGHVQIRLTRFFYDHYENPDYPVLSAVFIDKKEEIRETGK